MLQRILKEQPQRLLTFETVYGNIINSPPFLCLELMIIVVADIHPSTNMASTVVDSRTWSVQKDWDQAKLFLEIPNFHAVRSRMTSSGQAVTSKPISIGRSSFSVIVYPSGQGAGAGGDSEHIGVYLNNCSRHTVVADKTATVGNTTHKLKDDKFAALSALGWPTFMRAADVRPGANFVISVDIKLKKEEINGTCEEGVNKSFTSIKEVEDGVGKEMEKRLGVHAAEVRRHMVDTEGRLNDKIARVRVIAEDVEGEGKQAEKRLKTEIDGLKNEMGDVGEALGEKMAEVERTLKAEIETVKAPATDFIPVCLVCLDTLENLKIVQCMQGHKICEPCSEEEEVVACPNCKLAFLGRDMGMEACVQHMAEGSPAR